MTALAHGPAYVALAPAPSRLPVITHLTRGYAAWMAGTVLIAAGIAAGFLLLFTLLGEPVRQSDLAVMIGSVLGWMQAILLATVYAMRTPAVLTAGALRRDHLAAIGIASAVGLALDAALIAAYLTLEGFTSIGDDVGIAVLLIAAFHVAGVLVPTVYLLVGGLLGTLALPLTLPVAPVYLLSVDVGPRPNLDVALMFSLGWLAIALVAAVVLARSAPAMRRLV